jgi:hypothetical protein
VKECSRLAQNAGVTVERIDEKETLWSWAQIVEWLRERGFIAGRTEFVLPGGRGVKKSQLGDRVGL